MSFSVDDLVSSLSSSHIGQEARDLAILQAQLAESLFGATSSRQMPSRTRNIQPCTTPTARTPSYGYTGRARGNSVSSAYLDDMEEDERMVEELLIPSSPTMSGSHYGNTFNHPSSSASHMNSHSHPPSNTNGYSYNSYSEPCPSSPNSSMFATTDPFYMAQLQAANNSAAQQSQSVFAQNGRLAQNSPFAMPQYHSFHSHGQNYASAPFKTAAAF